MLSFASSRSLDSSSDYGAHDMGANAGIVAAESVAEMAMPIYVIGFDADAAQIERSGDFAALERGGPATMIGFDNRSPSFDRRAKSTNSFARSRASAVFCLTLALSHRPHLALYNAVTSPKLSPT